MVLEFIQNWFAIIILAIFSIAGFLLTCLGIGGTFIVFLGAVTYNLIHWSWAISLNYLIVLLALAVLGELLEWVISVKGLKKKGVSNFGVIGMVVGIILGAALMNFVPIFGTVIGVIVGGLLGALLGELIRTQDFSKAWKAAKAALLGRGMVILAKVSLVVIQLILINVAI